MVCISSVQTTPLLNRSPLPDHLGVEVVCGRHIGGLAAKVQLVG